MGFVIREKTEVNCNFAQLGFSSYPLSTLDTWCPTMLPRRSITKKPKPKRKSKGWAGLQAKDLEGIEQKIRDKFKWKHSPRNFQLEAIKAQVLRQDVLVHAGTGAGKSMIAAGPHALTDSAKKMVTFVVSPLIALQEEQVRQSET